MNILAGLASLAALSLFLAWFLKRSASLMPLLSVALAMVFFTVMGVAGLLWAGGLLWYALCLGALVFVLYKTGGRIHTLVTPGFVFFLVGGIAVAVYFALTQPMLTLWDEFTFWGTAGKVTSTANELYTTARSSLIARTYPPGLIVYTYMMQFFGGFSEPGFIASFAIFYLACLAPLGAMWDKHKTAAIVLYAAALLLPVLFETNWPAGQMMYTWLACMADLPMGLMFGGILCFYFCGGEKGGRLMLPYAVLLAALCLVKDMGLALACVALFVALVDMFFCERERLGFLGLRRGKALLVSALIGIAAIAGAYLFWAGHLNTARGIDRFNFGSMGESLGMGQMLISGVGMLFGIGRTEQFTEVLGLMARAFFTRPVFLLGPGVVMLALILIISLLALLLSATRRQRKRVVWFTLAMGLCFIAFYIFNLFTYSLVFQPGEALILKDYARYIAPFWMAWLMGALVQLARAATYHKATFYRLRMARAASGVVCLVLVCVLLLRGNGAANVLRISPSVYTARLDVLAVAQQAGAEGMRAEDTVYIISQGDDGTRFYQFGYELPAVRSLLFNGVKRDEMGEPVLDGEGKPILYGNAASTLVKPGEEHYGAFDTECAPEDLVDFLRQEGCTHLLIDEADTYVLEAFGPLFSDGLAGWGEESVGRRYYRVEWAADGSCTLMPQEGGAV